MHYSRPDVRPFTTNNEDGKPHNLHPAARVGPSTEFDGDVNPDTGEVGGPKTDPLRWKSEWTYGGRATDF